MSDGVSTSTVETSRGEDDLRGVAIGRRTFGIIAGDPRASASIDRCAGFLDALTGHGLGVDPAQAAPGGFDTPAGRGSRC